MGLRNLCDVTVSDGWVQLRSPSAETESELRLERGVWTAGTCLRHGRQIGNDKFRKLIARINMIINKNKQFGIIMY